MMLNRKFLPYIFILLCYVMFVITYKSFLFQKFNQDTMTRYFRSQDIEDINNEIKDRIFISDAEIYQATGYLYATGTSPATYNFAHPPLVKYLFGFSIKYFNLPLLPNMFFGLFLLFEVYVLGKLVFKNGSVGLLASLFLLVDPVFKEITIYSLLDLGEIVFILGFLITTVFYSKKYILSGILLGLATASKFYSPVVIFLGLIYIYKFLNKKLNIKHEFVILTTAFIIFNLIYLKAFPFNPFYNQAKTIKLMLTHNHAVSWGKVLPMFFGGFILWPISFFATIYNLLKEKFISQKFLLYLIPVFYFLVMTFQLPFTRYFILILPFLYLSLGNIFPISNWKMQGAKKTPQKSLYTI